MVAGNRSADPPLLMGNDWVDRFEIGITTMANTMRLLGFAALCGLFGNLAAAQESLLDVYQRAVQNDPAIREAEAAYLATAEAKPQARAGLLPTLDLSAGRSSQFSENPFGANLGDGSIIGVGSEIDADRNNWGIDLTQTVFNWSRFITVKQADKRVAQAETDYEAAKQDLLIRVAEVYFNVLAAEDTVAAEVVTREATARQLEQAQRRFEVGLIAITDVQEFQAAFDLAVATEIEAERSLATAHEFLREIIGESPQDLAGPVDDLPLLTPEPANPEQWVETALEQNLALVSSRIGADIAQDDIRIQRAARLPTVSFSAGYSEQDSEQFITLFFRDPSGNTISQDRFSPSAPDGYNWSLNLNVPLFSGGLNGSRIQQSVYRHRGALETLERVARQT